MGETNLNLKNTSASNALKLIIYSAIGIFMFFIPITIGSSRTILSIT